ncbi:MAG: GTP-binding protein [Verrucomicrobia bacterium]|nr:GTP-binding protein [Verrucomicrobiota bacterium]
MVTKKICMLGSFSVGKTSMVARFVQSTFSEKYLTTVGVKVDKKVVQVGGQDLTLMVWDLAGDDDYQKLNMSLLRGSAGFIYVADGTRAASLDAVLDIDRRVRREVGHFPSVLALNKADLAAQWELGEDRLAALTAEGWSARKTSAKLAQGVEETFLDLASRLLHA